MSGVQTQAQINKLLTDVSNGYFPKNYNSEKMLPELVVKQSSGKIGAYGLSHVRSEVDTVGGQGMARRVEPVDRRTSQQYFVDEHALEGVVTAADYRNVEQPFEAESDLTEALTLQILTNKELAIKSKLTSTAVLTQNVTLSGTDQFSDYANSDPIGVFKDAHNTVIDGCGMSPNAASMSKKLFNTLKYHPEILHNLGYAQNRAGQLSEQEIAHVMGVDELFICDAAYNTAKQGQTDVLAQVWGGDLVMYVKPSAAAKKQISLGYYMRLVDAKTKTVYKYPMNNPIGANAVIVQDHYSFEIVNALAGYLVKSAIA